MIVVRYLRYRFSLPENTKGGWGGQILSPYCECFAVCNHFLMPVIELGVLGYPLPNVALVSGQAPTWPWVLLP